MAPAVLRRNMTLGERMDDSIHSIDNRFCLGLATGFTIIVCVDLLFITTTTESGKRRAHFKGAMPIYLAHIASLALVGYQYLFAPKLGSPLTLIRHLSENVLGEGAAWY